MCVKRLQEQQCVRPCFNTGQGYSRGESPYRLTGRASPRHHDNRQHHRLLSTRKGVNGSVREGRPKAANIQNGALRKTGVLSCILMERCNPANDQSDEDQVYLRNQCLPEPGINIVFKPCKDNSLCAIPNYIPLWKRFSRLTPAKRYRYSTCPSDQFEDLMCWLWWQQKELPGTPSRQLLSVCEGAQSRTSAQSLRECRDTLQGVISQMIYPSDRLLLRILYIIAMMFREINLLELCSAISLASAVDTRRKGRVCQVLNDREVTGVVETCSKILVIDAENVIKFQNPAMQEFLITSNLADFRDGHLLMGQIYLEELQQNDSLNILRPWMNFRAWYSQTYQTSFSIYLARYGHEHCRQAQRRRPIICGDIYRVMLKAFSSERLALVSTDSSSIEAQKNKIDCFLEVSLIYGFIELAAVYRDMGAVTDFRNPKLLPRTLKNASVKSAGTFEVTIGQQISKHDQTTQFVIHPVCNQSKQGISDASVQALTVIMRDTNISPNRNTNQSDCSGILCTRKANDINAQMRYSEEFVAADGSDDSNGWELIDHIEAT